jgi:hypothetical protein
MAELWGKIGVMEVKMKAVRLSDLMEMCRDGGAFPIKALLADFIKKDDPTLVLVEKDMVDGYAVVFDGPAAQDPERLTACIELLKRIGKMRLGREVRIYEQGPRGGWRKI